MPRVDRDGVSLYYEIEGDGPTVAFIEDLGYGAWQWAWQHAALSRGFETLAWDLRGTGHSDVPEGPYTVDELAADLEAVLSEEAIRNVHLVGAGLGGAIALQYALDYDRARSLTLIGTSAGGHHLPEEPVRRLFAPRDDPDSLRETLNEVLTDEFAVEQPAVVDGIVRWRAGERPAVTGEGGPGGGSPSEETPPDEGLVGDVGTQSRGGDAMGTGWRAQAAALETFDLRDRLHEITEPALVIHGTADSVWPPEGGLALAEGLPRGRHEAVQSGPHLVHVEQSRIVNDLVVDFLEELVDR